jgi:SynChlorMet cassette radical SAM/SPASM protein ScmF
VRHLASVGLGPQIIFTVLRHNCHQVDDVVALAQTLGAGSVKFNVLQPTARGRALAAADDALSIEEYVQIGRHVDGLNRAGRSIATIFDYPAAFRPLSRLSTADGGGTCGILGILGVLPDGSYALCGIGRHVPELVFGSVRDDSLADIWHSDPHLQLLREALPQRLRGVCGDCLCSERCLGGCVAQNYYRTGDLLEPFWFCETADREGLFPDSRRRSVRERV